jgi:alpha-galactosidase
MLAAPLLAGNDLRTMTDETKEILLNKEVIAIDQDRAGHQGHRVAQDGETETWVRELADGAMAVAFFNRGATETTMKAVWKDLGIAKATKVRDLWTHADLTGTAEGFSAMVPSHGVILLRVSH